MHQVDVTEIGLTIHISGHVEESEVRSMYEDVLQQLPQLPADFKVFIDMRGFNPANAQVGQFMAQLQQACIDQGVSRSIVIVDSTESKLQMQRLAKENGVEEIEKYVTPQEHPQWEPLVIDWLMEGVDPYLAKA